MTFRQDAPLIVQYGIFYGMMVPVDLALVCLVPEYVRIFLLLAAMFFVFLLLNKKMHPNAVTVDTDSISCYRGEQLVWAFQRTQIVELKKSNRYYLPSAEIVARRAPKSRTATRAISIFCLEKKPSRPLQSAAGRS